MPTQKPLSAEDRLQTVEQALKDIDARQGEIIRLVEWSIRERPKEVKSALEAIFEGRTDQVADALMDKLSAHSDAGSPASVASSSVEATVVLANGRLLAILIGVGVGVLMDLFLNAVVWLSIGQSRKTLLFVDPWTVFWAATVVLSICATGAIIFFVLWVYTERKALRRAKNIRADAHYARADRSVVPSSQEGDTRA